MKYLNHMDDSFLEKWPNWLRWVLAWPAGLVGSLLLAGLIKLIWSGMNENVAPWFLDLIQAGFIGFLAVYIPAWFAPTKKKIVTIVSLCILISLTFLLSGFVLYGSLMGIAIENPLQFWVSMIAYVVAGIFATVAIHSEVE